MDDTSLQRKLLQMVKEVRSLKIAHERGLGVVQMWRDEASMPYSSSAYLYVKPIDSANFFASIEDFFNPLQYVASLTIQADGTWKYKIINTRNISFLIQIIANNQFTWRMEAA
jgi:hypothetical protein